MIYKKANAEVMKLFEEKDIIVEDVLYTLNQASYISGKHRDTLTNNHKKGNLNIVRDGSNKPLILGSDLINFISVG